MKRNIIILTRFKGKRVLAFFNIKWKFVSYKSLSYISQFLVYIRKQTLYIFMGAERFVLSANYIGSRRLEAILRSLTYKRKMRCANVKPWQNPHLTCSKLSFVVGSISIYCFLFERKRFMQLWLLPLIPYNSSFLSSIVWSTISQAFERLINTPSVYKLFSKAWNIWSKNWIIAWSVEWPNWKPNYLG